MKKVWIVFRHNGKKLLSISVSGMVDGEIAATKELLAYERQIPVDEICVSVETNS